MSLILNIDVKCTCHESNAKNPKHGLNFSIAKLFSFDSVVKYDRGVFS